MQAAHEVLPAGEELCSVQSVHAALPVVDLNWSPAQAVQGPPLAPVYPTLHAQAVFRVLPVVGELLFAGQS